MVIRDYYYIVVKAAVTRFLDSKLEGWRDQHQSNHFVTGRISSAGFGCARTHKAATKRKLYSFNVIVSI